MVTLEQNNFISQYQYQNFTVEAFLFLNVGLRLIVFFVTYL